MPSKSKPFIPLVEPISPPPQTAARTEIRPKLRLVVEAPGTAPGSERLIPTAFITIAGRIRHTQYSHERAQKKEFAASSRKVEVRGVTDEASGRRCRPPAGKRGFDTFLSFSNTLGAQS